MECFFSSPGSIFQNFFLANPWYSLMPLTPLNLVGFHVTHIGWGVPAGCALAVAAMLALSAALYHHLKHRPPDTTPFTFADNWALKFLPAAHAPLGIIALEEFWFSLPLRISVSKSWLWTLNEKTTRLVEGLTLQRTPIRPVKHKRDFQKKSLALGLHRCREVTKQNHANKKAGKLLLSSCFPKAAYGIEIQMPTKKEFSSFRTSAARSLGLARIKAPAPG